MIMNVSICLLIYLGSYFLSSDNSGLYYTVMTPIYNELLKNNMEYVEVHGLPLQAFSEYKLKTDLQSNRLADRQLALDTIVKIRFGNAPFNKLTRFGYDKDLDNWPERDARLGLFLSRLISGGQYKFDVSDNDAQFLLDTIAKEIEMSSIPENGIDNVPFAFEALCIIYHDTPEVLYNLLDELEYNDYLSDHGLSYMYVSLFLIDADGWQDFFRKKLETTQNDGVKTVINRALNGDYDRVAHYWRKLYLPERFSDTLENKDYVSEGRAD